MCRFGPFSFQKLLEKCLFPFVLVRRKEPAKMGEAEPDQIGRQRVELIVAHDLVDLSVRPQISYIPTSAVELAWDATGGSDFVQRWPTLSRPGSQDLHEINVPVAWAEIVHPIPRLVGTPGKSRRADAVDEGSLEEDGEIGVTRVEADELRVVFANALEKTTQDLTFVELCLPLPRSWKAVELQWRFGFYRGADDSGD